MDLRFEAVTITSNVVLSPCLLLTSLDAVFQIYFLETMIPVNYVPLPFP